jgi:AcrR family transcriptional regulator
MSPPPQPQPRPARSSARRGPARPRPAWAGEPPQREAARERLLEAAARCIARDGLSATGIASVADEAGVSRPTVYRYFDDRDALIEAALHRAGAVVLSAMTQHLLDFPRPEEKAVEAVVFALREIPAHPVLRQVWSSALVEAAVVESFTGPRALALCRAALEGLVASAGWSDAEAREAIELMLRVALSLLVAPEPRRSERALRSFLQRRLVPALGFERS